MNNLTRREFFGRSIIGAGSLATLPALVDAKETAVISPPQATDRVELGNTGIKVSHIAMGTGFKGYNQSSSQTRMGHDKFETLMRHGFDNGINFYDMADLYGSHSYFRPVLDELPREDVVLLSKIWFSGGSWIEPTDRAKPAVERFLKEVGTDYLDVVLIHCVTNPRWPSQLERMRDELSELKSKGVVRAVGCSCHSLQALKVAADHPWVDIIFARINNQQKVMDGPPEVVADVLKKARNNGKSVVGMKIYGAGQLVEKEQREESLRYVWGNDLIDAMTIGFEKTAQVNDSIEHLTKVLKS